MAAFRALLTAHFQTSWNSSAREMGRQGVLVMGLLVALLGLLGAGPLFLGMGGLGCLLGRSLDESLAPASLGVVLTLLSLGGGLFGGVAGGARQLSWEAYRGFPLGLRTLYFAELVAQVRIMADAPGADQLGDDEPGAQAMADAAERDVGRSRHRRQSQAVFHPAAADHEEPVIQIRPAVARAGLGIGHMCLLEIEKPRRAS